MDVLSLFDGISCGQLALARAGVAYDNYFASEVDAVAVGVALSNFPETVMLGDVCGVEGGNLPEIGLLLGGSPCQGFSVSGLKRGFDDPRSRLFFEFVRLLDECEPEFFLLENVRMRGEWRDIISRYVGVEPIEINSGLLSAQSRRRLYWTNIPGVVLPDDLGLVLRDVLVDGVVPDCLFISGRYACNWRESVSCDVSRPIRLGEYGGGGQGQRVHGLDGKSVSLSALGGGWGAKTGLYLVDGRVRRPTQGELERLQTVPGGYTRNATYGQACRLLGNAFTVDVVAHILSFLPGARGFVPE